ncbi:hypothetical protein PPYR_13682 [Photinus pyralis]|uniref:Peptidase S1 domain-containing protein n=1 Tax=Photinus pyralis TaxID=7054 RepID=A0A1Y1MQM5_PHOPY|nr:modular serine protease-like [Photinus pyralis]KAB0794062.1 hypothetical protein PPYR_13682 [Photinus pyralis]
MYVFIIILFYVAVVKSNNSTGFVCVDGTKIELHEICDGLHQCPDGSDESRTLCHHIICPKDMFRCYYGACIKRHARCDGVHNCVDKSDEINCERSEGCTTSEFQCLSRECIPLEKICDTINDCSDNSDESLHICRNHDFVCPEDTYRCKHGGCVKFDTLCDGFNDCVDGSDESKVICDGRNCLGGKYCRKEILCPPLMSQRVDIKCKSKDGPRSCRNPLPVGAIAYSRCKVYYRKKHRQVGDHRSICQPDGTWSRGQLLCEPECGITAPLATPLIVHGWNSEKQRWPWHATLYSLQHGNWTFWCGGSLITEQAIITAAHCVWSIKASDLKVALGKHFRNFEKIKYSPTTFDVSTIVIQPHYQDVTGNYGSDLAILILNRMVELSEYIKPVCIDWNDKDFTRFLDNGTLGMIVGMGITEHDTYSETLKATYLPAVSNNRCIDAQHQDFKKYVTFTTFCAGWQNGTGVCNGDSGGGLVFDKYGNKTWVLEGIVSVSPRRLGTSFCDTSFFTIFTKVGMYVDWINSVLNLFNIN